MKKSELQKIIKEEIKSLIKESKEPIPYNHTSEADGRFIALRFNSQADCVAAKKYYSQLYPRDISSGKGFVLPVTAIVKFLVKNLQNQVYNPPTE